MLAVRELSADLHTRLERARQLELLAETEEQYRRAVYATTNLLGAARAVGWRLGELAGPVGLSANTVSKRVNDARRGGRLTTGGLVVDAPMTTRAALAEFDAPEEQRQWLTRAEAGAYAGVAARTIHGWNERGLLPHTRTVGKRWRAYLRADIDHVLKNRPVSGPRTG